MSMRVAEAFPPGDFIIEELEARGWTQADLARVMGRPVQAVNEICRGRKRITPETAKELELALGPSAAYWMNLEAAYRLWRAGDPDRRIMQRRRALERRLAG